MENCKFYAFRHCSKNEVSAHMIWLHKHDPQYVISCAVCGHSYAKYESYGKHVQRGHKNVAIENNEIIAVAITEDHYVNVNLTQRGDKVITCSELFDQQCLSYLFQLRSIHGLFSSFYVLLKTMDCDGRKVAFLTNSKFIF